MIDQKLSLLAIAISISMAGCSFMPTLTRYDKINPSDSSKAIPCLASDIDISKAKNCALAVIEDMSDYLGDEGVYKKSMAFTLLGTGTAAAGVIAFSPHPTNALKGLALATGALLGLNSVVNPDKLPQV